MKFGTLAEQEELYRMAPKAFKLDFAFKLTPNSKNKGQITTMGFTLKARPNWNDFVAI